MRAAFGTLGGPPALAKRPRFAPLPLVSGVAAVTLLVLALLYPAKDALVQDALDSNLTDPVAEQYLLNLLRARPQDKTLRIRLAEQALTRGKHTEVLRVLEPILYDDDPAWRLRAARLVVEAQERGYYDAPATSIERRQFEAAFRTQLIALGREENNPLLLERLARKALAIGEPGLATQMLKRVATIGARGHEWYAEAGRIALAAGDYKTSAAMYLEARTRAQDPAQQRKYLRAALRSLESGALQAEAVALAAETAGSFESDPELSALLARLYAQSKDSAARVRLRDRLRAALARKVEDTRSAEDLERLLAEAKKLGDYKLARELVRRQAEQGGASGEHLARLLVEAKALDDNKLARELVRRQAEQSGASREHIGRLIAEAKALGDYELARKLVRRQAGQSGASEEYVRRLVAEAKALGDYELARELARRQADQSGASAEHMEAWLVEARALDDTELAARLVKRLAELKPDRDAAWYAGLAKLALSHGDYLSSTRLYWHARRVEPDPKLQRTWYVEGLRVLQAGNLLGTYLEEAERELGDLANDQQVLYTFATLARAADRADIAERYARRMMHMDS